MKLFITLLILLAGWLPAFSADFWEPLDGPYGGVLDGAVQTDNYLFLFNSGSLLRSSDKGITWSSCFKSNEGINYFNKLFYTSDKHLYVVATKGDNPNKHFFLSTDEGTNWTYLNHFSGSNFLGDIKINNKFIYSLNIDTLSYCNLKDSTIFRKKLNYKYINTIHIDNSDNLYLFNNHIIYVSTDMGDNVKEIRNSKGNIVTYAFDKDNKLFYSEYDSKDNCIFFTNDKGDTWQKIIIPLLPYNFIILDKNSIYVIPNDNSLWLIEYEDTVKFSKLFSSSIDSGYISNLFLTKDYILAWKSNYSIYISNDKYLQNLNEIKLSLHNDVILSAGNKLLVVGSSKIQHLSGNKIIDFEHPELSNTAFRKIFTSRKDYFWFTRISMGPLETYYSIDTGKTLKGLSFIYSPVTLDENSRGELFAISWGSKLENSKDQVKWDKFDSISFFSSDQLIINHNDDMLIFHQRTYSLDNDSLYLSKLNGSNYNELSKEFLNLTGKFVKAVISQNSLMFILTSNTVFRTSDEGTTLEVVLDGTAKGRVFRDILAVKDIIYIATDKGVLISEDNGITWSDFNDGLNTANCLSLAKTGDNTVYVGLSQDVVYRSTKLTDIPTTEIPSDFLILPNPAEEDIEISVGSRHALTNSDIRIFNVFGEIVKNPTPTLPEGEGIRIDVSGLPSGVYFVKVGDKVGKFVKI